MIKLGNFCLVSSLLMAATYPNQAVLAKEEKHDYFSLSLESLANIKVVTSSRREQSIEESYANIQVITKEMIQRRGYRNVIEILEDLPGFDFSTYEDGGGEYPSHFLNRGIGGDNGNTRLLVMVDGLVQNHISYNWSQGLTDEQILQDIERIEVVQGPGSSLYGAQAVSGIIHIITKQKFTGTDVKVVVGKNNSRSMELMHGGALGEVNYQIALKHLKSDGDQGKGRADPGSYFSNNQYPDFLTADYDENGNYVTNVPHPRAGTAIPDGYNNLKDNTAIRFKMTVDNFQVGVNYWDRKNGLGNYVVGYEYEATAPDFISHHSGLTVYMKNKKFLIDNKLKWKTDLWYRLDKQESDTGFEYIYRFNGLKKTYHSASSQIGFENQFDWSFDNDKTLTIGARLLGNRQTDQVISLGAEQSGNESTTSSSWDIAVAGGGLNQEKVNEVFDETETAVYALFEGRFNPKLSYSIGNRFSIGSDYGSTNTPRAGLIYNPDDKWVLKALYGAAFRQPSLFELHDEFRGAEDLKPEKIDTFELEFSRKINSRGQIKFNLFYSSLEDSIGLIQDLTRSGGERYANIDEMEVRGFSSQMNYSINDDWSFYANYLYQQGASNDSGWGKAEHTAQHKLNLGTNWQPLERFNINFRMNYVGERVPPESNEFFVNEAPEYTKIDVVFTWADLFEYSGLTAQLAVNNILDESYFGLGRQAGSSVRAEYDPASMPDPTGFIPPYHPQPGRMVFGTLNYHF